MSIEQFTNTQPWMEQGACRDAEDFEVFFPSPGERADEAKSYCASCPVALKCLKYALDNHEVGVWGGTTDRERYAIHRRNTHGAHACHICPAGFRSRQSLTAHLAKAHQALPLFCANGHEWTPENTITKSDGRRRCSLCLPPNSKERNAA